MYSRQRTAGKDFVGLLARSLTMKDVNVSAHTVQHTLAAYINSRALQPRLPSLSLKQPRPLITPSDKDNYSLSAFIRTLFLLSIFNILQFTIVYLYLTIFHK